MTAQQTLKFEYTRRSESDTAVVEYRLSFRGIVHVGMASRSGVSYESLPSHLKLWGKIIDELSRTAKKEAILGAVQDAQRRLAIPAPFNLSARLKTEYEALLMAIDDHLGQHPEDAP